MVRAAGLVKRYPGVIALDRVDFEVGPGEVVALVGENGAGKSTLIKLLGGLALPDAGEIDVDGVPVRLAKPADATRRGIAILRQELSNLDNLDVAGNVFLGREPRRFGLLDRAEAERRTLPYLRMVGLDAPPDAPVAGLSVAQQQLVEIAKALALEARILVMDEPTSSLTAGETERLLEIVRDLRARGVGVVYVSHRLGEVVAVADRVVVLRDGKNAGALPAGSITVDAMVRLMVGRELAKAVPRAGERAAPRLVVAGLRTARYPNHPLSFEVGAGEILAVAGLIGAGRTELARSIFGVEGRLAGEVRLDGAVLPPGSPRKSIAAGLFLAPEDRRVEGLVASLSIRENVCLPALAAHARFGLSVRRRESAAAEAMASRLRIKAPSIESSVSGLSGGNQQKVVLAKWLALKPKCLIFDEPTRGIDVGARAEIYDLMRALADSGVAILMISSDMEEVLGVGDRILVMHEGAVAGELSRAEADEEAVMRLAVGVA